jgi:hypothetical protein
MAKAKLNPILDAMIGALGDVVIKRYGRKFVIAKKPVFTDRVFSVAQKENQNKFKEAAKYAVMALADGEMAETYREEAKHCGTSARSVAVRDFLNAPQVEDIDLRAYDGRAGRKILVRASDDVGVTRVDVTIADEQGTILEQGAAELIAGKIWKYVSTVSVPAGTTVSVGASAFDRPGHSAVLRKGCEIP